MDPVTPIVVSKGEIAGIITDLVKKINASGRKFTTVVGIERGGVHISRIVADCLDAEHKTVRIGFYEGDARSPGNEPHIVERNGFDLHKCVSCLVVDDLIDRGSTITAFKKIFGWREHRDAIAVLYWKRGSITPDFYGREKPENWLIFPWEQ